MDGIRYGAVPVRGTYVVYKSGDKIIKRTRKHSKRTNEQAPVLPVLVFEIFPP